MGENNWYRVVDPLNPLSGCDVRVAAVVVDGPSKMAIVDALRRIDVFVGDRPFQLIAPEGQSLGIWVRTDHLAVSPLQDDLVELSTEQPYGECLDDWEVTRGDGLTLHVAAFEHAVQVALLKDGGLLKTRTYGSLYVPDQVREMFEDGRTADEIVEHMAVGDGEEDQ